MSKPIDIADVRDFHLSASSAQVFGLRLVTDDRGDGAAGIQQRRYDGRPDVTRWH